jgi:hypothetical protein
MATAMDPKTDGWQERCSVVGIPAKVFDCVFLLLLTLLSLQAGCAFSADQAASPDAGAVEPIDRADVARCRGELPREERTCRRASMGFEVTMLNHLVHEYACVQRPFNVRELLHFVHRLRADSAQSCTLGASRSEATPLGQLFSAALPKDLHELLGDVAKSGCFGMGALSASERAQFYEDLASELDGRWLAFVLAWLAEQGDRDEMDGFVSAILRHASSAARRSFVSSLLPYAHDWTRLHRPTQFDGKRDEALLTLREVAPNPVYRTAALVLAAMVPLEMKETLSDVHAVDLARIGQAAAGVHHYPGLGGKLRAWLGVSPTYFEPAPLLDLLRKATCLGEAEKCVIYWVATQLDDLPGVADTLTAADRLEPGGINAACSNANLTPVCAREEFEPCPR